ncbi:hypothetical protein [Actinoallomurus sp. NPDC050550]|uniref:hypothetical protein n=1 Tax=Actinoallomurus sp. NPDC050550 TaxID=3154937 RepID=UPI0033FE3C96
MNVPDDALDALTDRDPRGRDIAAAELGDLLRAKALDPAIATLVVSQLVAAAVNDPTHAVRESALNSILEASIHYHLPLELFTPLLPELTTMDPELLEYTLYLLGSTQDPAAAELIRPFLDHPSVHLGPHLHRRRGRAHQQLRLAGEDRRRQNHSRPGERRTGPGKKHARRMDQLS